MGIPSTPAHHASPVARIRARLSPDIWRGHRRALLVGTALLALGAVPVLFRMESPLAMALGIAAVLALAGANGGNDVSKTVATLVGAGLASYHRALLWGAFWTGLGALASAFVARRLAEAFATALSADSVVWTAEQSALAVILGALGWVVLANALGLPISTTHAILGAIAGMSVVVHGIGGVAWGDLARTFLLPLAASPVLAVGLGLVAYSVVRPLSGATWAASLHWLSSAAASLARGLNDAPKIAALGAVFGLVGGQSVPLWVFLGVAVAMLAGSSIAGRSVSYTLAERTVMLDRETGLGANLSTALLVGSASFLALPVSTTHVSGAAIVGLGVRRASSTVHWRIVGVIALAWLVTLPVAALLAALALLLLVR